MITAIHTLVYSDDPTATRAFFKDVLRWPFVSEGARGDAGTGGAGTGRALYARISQDPRHDSVTLLESGTVGERVFSRWSMARVGEGDEVDIPPIAHTDGISPAAGRRTTPEQDAVLEVMRKSARSSTSA